MFHVLVTLLILKHSLCNYVCVYELTSSIKQNTTLICSVYDEVCKITQSF